VMRQARHILDVAAAKSNVKSRTLQGSF
jgi:hypothetical protein